MNFLIDMNLSPAWVERFQDHGYSALHWSDVGEVNAPDMQIMMFAKEKGYIVFTHDLDFGRLLAITREEMPSVVQVRANDVAPVKLERLVFLALNEFESQLERGALVVIDEARYRARLLPIQ